MTWIWSVPNPDIEAASGDLSALFRGQTIASPGVLESGKPDDDATLLARESIQNSWDSAIDRSKRSGVTRPEMGLKFIFSELTGDTKNALVDSLELAELKKRERNAGGWREIGLARETALSSVGNSKRPLKTLTVTETGTGGMYGPWEGAKSRMFFALLTIGYTIKSDGSGGSYGYGKAGLISSTATRTVIAYSCFKEEENDPGVTRRLLGVNYWKPHKISKTDFTGFGRFGAPTGENTCKPFENEEADRQAQLLGLVKRSANNEEEIGTTFLIIEPTVEPKQLVRAIERNWWPALTDNDGFEVSVIDYSNQELLPSPKERPELKAFIAAYELAKGREPDNNETERMFFLESNSLEGRGQRKYPTGRLGLVANPEGWSWPTEDDDATNHCSLIALVRGPRMVTEYSIPVRPAPYIRGTFIADSEIRTPGDFTIDDLLRQTEPPLHNKWQVSKTEQGIDPDAPGVAGAVHKRIKARVTSFREALRPPAPEKGRYRFQELEDIWAELTGSKQRGDRPPPPPPGPPREISHRILKAEAIPSENSLDVELVSEVSFDLTDAIDANETPAQITIEYRYVANEQGNVDSTGPGLLITPPDGFHVDPKDPTTFFGNVQRNDERTFKIRSNPYDADWQAKLIVTASHPITPGGVNNA
ncbi:MAG: hypothetical protein HON60_05910 [Gammaproteobacteria bacterium]|jgi:hypothetical protein|nr:hypothetical protein [Gammaproteobacteria bacterium]